MNTQWIDITLDAAKGRAITKRGGARITSESIGVSVVASAKGDDFLQICVRISEPLMAKARLVAGDRVVLLYAPNENLCLLKRTINGGYVLSPAGTTKKGQTKDLQGKVCSASVRFRWVDSLPVKKERMPIVECENVSLGNEGILFSIPRSAMR